MIHNTQRSPRVETELESFPANQNDDPHGLVDTLKVVACPICRALYVPTEQPPIDSTSLLETAFLGVCRFCFRCQRPACPQCWNPVHQTCACCSEEADLPFRTPVPSLEGLVFLPSNAVLSPKECAISFTCQRNGRFYTREGSPSRMGTIQPSAPASSSMTVLDAFPTIASSQSPGVSESQYPAWLQEILGQKETERMAVLPTENEFSIPQFNASTASESLLHTPETEQIRTSASVPPMAEYAGESISQDDQGADEISLFERIENMLIILTSILLLAVILMIVLSIVSPQVNAFFLHLLHIDIRTEIAYLLQLR